MSGDVSDLLIPSNTLRKVLESISEEEYNELVESKMKEFDDKWVRCIVLRVYSG